MTTHTRPARPRVGFLRPEQVERAFIALLYLVLAVLVGLSVLGTFYGRQGKAAPLVAPTDCIQPCAGYGFWQVLGDITTNLPQLGIAAAIQATLTIVQYGARQKARQDRRWWLLYLVALGWSVYYNWQAYWTPLTVFVAGYLAALLIVAGDVLPEFLAVRRE